MIIRPEDYIRNLNKAQKDWVDDLIASEGFTLSDALSVTTNGQIETIVWSENGQPTVAKDGDVLSDMTIGFPDRPYPF